MSSRNDNIILTRATFISTVGDFVSLFAVLILVHKITKDALLASLVVPIETMAIAFSGLIIPSLLARFRIKNVLFLSQIISSFLMGFLCYYWTTQEPSSTVILGVFFVLAVLNRTFMAARESHSRLLGEQGEQRKLQNQLMSGFFRGQFLGPLISLLLLEFFPLYVPLAVDCLTYLLAAILVLRIDNLEGSEKPSSILRPLTYVWKDKPLFRIFILRSIGYWVPIGIFNYLLFSVVVKHYQLDLSASAWVYAAIGLGSSLSYFVLKNKHVARLPDHHIAFYALIALALTRFAYISLPSLFLGFFAIVLAGICNGLNAITTQSLRRKITSDSQFAEVVSLELIVGQVSATAIASAMYFVVSNGIIDYRMGIVLSAIVLIPLALAHRTNHFDKFSPSMNRKGVPVTS